MNRPIEKCVNSINVILMLTLIQFLNGIEPLNEDIQQYLLRHLKQKRLSPGET